MCAYTQAGEEGRERGGLNGRRGRILWLVIAGKGNPLKKVGGSGGNWSNKISGVFLGRREKPRGGGGGSCEGEEKTYPFAMYKKGKWRA